MNGSRAHGRIAAAGLLDEQEKRNLRTGFKRVFPLPADRSFDDVLMQLNIAMHRSR